MQEDLPRLSCELFAGSSLYEEGAYQPRIDTHQPSAPLGLGIFQFQLSWFHVFTYSCKWLGMWFLPAWGIAS